MNNDTCWLFQSLWNIFPLSSLHERTIQSTVLKFGLISGGITEPYLPQNNNNNNKKWKQN